MPIHPDKAKLYPGGSIRSPEWLAIRERVRQRAGNRCEGCGVENHALGGRLRDGSFVKALPTGDNGLRLTWPREGEWAWCGSGEAVYLRVIRIVCTVAHIDGKLVDHSDANLAFWCQRCHLRHDAAQHRANAAITRHEKRGQPDMLGRE